MKTSVMLHNMLYYFRLIKDLFQINPAIILKPLAFGIVISVLCWNYLLKKPIYQSLYGIKNTQKLEIVDLDSFIDISEQKKIPLNINGYDIEIQPIKKFSTTARIIYIDRYTKLGSWYRSTPAAAQYDAIVPQDLSWATGEMGKQYKCLNLDHEYRCLIIKDHSKCNFQFQNEAKSNNHTIAANTNIQKGLDILSVGDIAQIEGYAIYWNGTGNLSNQVFESAITLGQESPDLYGGQKSTLCRQILITKLTFDGYTFE